MIDLKRIHKAFGSFTALDHIDLTIPTGRMVALLGPSGSGKTTLLRIIAGLEHADSGTILMDGNDATNLDARDRQIGFVFQHYALFRHMTVADNIAFGLTVRPRGTRPSKGDIADRVNHLLSLVQLNGLGGRYPAQLSGGQRQRVALARALAVEPRLLLLDEPFGALDAQVRKDLRRWMRRLHDDMGLTSVFVTHDQEEALELADEVVVMSHGRIEQIGTPAEIYDNPATPFVYQFLGNATKLTTTVQSGAARLNGWDIPCAANDGPAVAFARPHDWSVETVTPGSGNAVLRHAAVLGSSLRMDVTLNDGQDIEVDIRREPGQRIPEPGQPLTLTPKRLAVFGT